MKRWNADRYGITGAPGMANACLNPRCSGRARDSESFARYLARRGIAAERRAELDARGWWGRPRVPARCEWPVGPCLPGCPARHVDLDVSAATPGEAAADA